MRDDFKGGLLAFLIAGPAMVICCGGLLMGSAFLGGVLAAIGAWLSGLNGIAVIIAAVGAFIVVREIRRRRRRRSAAQADDEGASFDADAPDVGARKERNASETFDGVL